MPKNTRPFDRWLHRVDEILIEKHGLTSDDGADWPSYDTWESGASPVEGAEAWEEAQGMY